MVLLMTKRHINPDNIASPGNFSHVVVVDSGRLVFVAGQVPKAPDNSIVGVGDLNKQARQCLLNVRDALAAVGASPTDIVKLTVYIVGYKPAHRDILARARFDILPCDPLPAATLVGVDSLAHQDYLVEIEAIAVLSPL